MSDQPHGHGWWQASDNKWYPPERHPNYLTPPPPPPETYTPARASAQHGGQRKLTDAERAQILDVALMSRARPTVSVVNGWLNLRVPSIKRSTTTAEISWGRTLTDPLIIVLLAVLSFVTCGLFTPVWFLQTLRNPNIQTVFVDEYGNQHWAVKPITQAQRVLSSVVIIGIVCWLFWWVNIWQTSQCTTCR
jgi:hypothetical protein